MTNAQIRGSLYGVAIGDALGAPWEFVSASEIRQSPDAGTSMTGGGWLRLQPGQWTDDTDMTLAVAAGIAAANLAGSPQDPVPAIGQEFILWLDAGPVDVGLTIQTAIVAAKRNGGDWPAAALTAHRCLGGQSAGNGALMRTAPVAWFYQDPDTRRLVAAAIAGMTHYDPLAAATCILYVDLLANADRIPGEGVWGVVEQVGEEAAAQGDGQQGDVIREAMEQLDRYRKAGLTKYESLAAVGLSLNSLAITLWAVETSRSFEEAVGKAVRLGGDADTNGAITGGLAGAVYGIEAIPERWVAAVRAVPGQAGRLDATISRLNHHR